MSNIETKTLMEVLNDVGLCELPKEDNGRKAWYKAIGLVTKKNGTQSYAVLKRNSAEDFSVSKIYGDISPISKIECVYPYEFIDMSDAPKFAARDRLNRIEYLNRSNAGERTDLETLKTEELAGLVKDAIVNEQIKKMEKNEK